MRKLIFVCALLPCVAALAGCPKKGADADAGDDGAAAAAAAALAAAAPAEAGAVAPVAKNAADVARFPAGEKAVADDDQKIVELTQARTAPHGGAVVASVKVGTDPFKIAEFQDAVLVTFPDPKDASASLMGWVAKSAFVGTVIVDAGVRDASKDAAVDAAVVPGLLKCAAGQEAIINLTSAPVCRRKCTTDKDCKVATPGACAAGSTLAGKITKVCANEAP